MHIENIIDIQAPTETVWGLTVAVEDWPRITPTMTSIERLDEGPLRLGSRARVKPPRQRPAVWTVQTFTPARGFSWATKVMTVTMIGTHEIEPTADGCRNRLGLDVTGPGAAFFGRLVKGLLAKAIATENEGFKRAAESSTP
jgi:hypothetical protein